MKSLGLIPFRFVQALVAVLSFTALGALAQEHSPALDGGIEQQVRSLALAGTQHEGPGTTRVEVEVGQLDPRLRLAPCQRVQPYLPPSARLWGKTRIGLRCLEGPTHWNVYLPITVKIYGKALVAAVPLAAGSVIGPADLAQAEVDLAEDASPAMTDASLVQGRTLSRALNAGEAVRQSHVKPRQWFAAGDVVTIIAQGAGFSVSSEGQALTPGLEGQPARVRTDSGRVLTGMPIAEHRLELAL